MKDTAVIIVNYNGERFLKGCLDSLYCQTYKEFNIILIDNNSTDGSVAIIERSYPNIHLIRLDKNTGFAAANNIGIRHALSSNTLLKYVVLLNNDTVCDKDFLKELVNTAASSNDIGMAASKMLFFDRKDYINNAGGMIAKEGYFTGIGFNEKDGERFNSERTVLAPSGGAGLYTVEMLLSVKYGDEFFDESFFAYHEDIDIAWRGLYKGWRCLYNPKAIVYHHHSGTFGISPYKKYLCIRNNIWCLYKCLPSNIFKKMWLHIVWYHFKLFIKYTLLLDLSAARAIKDAIKGFGFLKDKRANIQDNKTISDDAILKIWGEEGFSILREFCSHSIIS